MKIARIVTNKGAMEFELLENDAPNTVEHFCQLVEEGFYNGKSFFLYIPNTLIQTGCPQNDGSASAGFLIKCELTGERQPHLTGCLSKPNIGRNTNGSQFFIGLKEENLHHLDGNHTVFGHMLPKDRQSLEVLKELRRFDRIEHIEVDEVEEQDELEFDLDDDE